MKVLFSILFLLIPSCGENSISEKEKWKVSQTISDILLVQQIYKFDSIRSNYAIDSIIKNNGYKNRIEFNLQLENLSKNSNSLREMFDSSNRLIDKVKKVILNLIFIFYNYPPASFEFEFNLFKLHIVTL